MPARTAPGEAAVPALVDGVEVAPSHARVGRKGVAHRLVVAAELLHKIVENVDVDDFHVQPIVTRVFDELRLDGRTDKLERGGREYREHLLRLRPHSGRIFTDADDIAVGMHCVIRGGRLAQEFRRMHHALFWKFFLYAHCLSGKHRRFDDGHFAVAYERYRLPHDGIIEARRCGGSRHGDKYDVAVLYLVLVVPVRLFERVAHDRVSATFELVRIIFPDESLPHVADRRPHLSTFFFARTTLKTRRR